MSKIKVLIVDDSALIRSILSEIMAEDPQIEVVGTAIDPYDAREKIKQFNPDVITLDVEMPKMDGLSFLEKIMTLRPTPVIMVSTLTGKGTDVAIRALEIGAVDCIAKPRVTNEAELNAFGLELCRKIHIAAKARLSKNRNVVALKEDNNKIYKLQKNAPKLIAIGASTGGVETITEIMMQLPKETPPIIITQHMPAGFTQSFANRLSTKCALQIAEASQGMKLEACKAIIACGGRHLQLHASKTHYECVVEDGELVSGHKPSVDVMFNSVAKYVKDDALGIILTGMGKDGAKGLLAMREAGAHTIAQSEASCVVYGMPRQAVEIGAANEIIDLHNIAKIIKQRCFQ